MNKELVKKVYEHYNGVWPSRADVILTTAEGWTGCEDIAGKFTEGWYDGGAIIHDISRIVPDSDSECVEPYMDENEAWIIACTEDQFKAYGDSLKKDENCYGLPAVGCKCEYFDRVQKEWGVAFIVAHHMNGEEAIWSSHPDGGELFYGSPCDFRPIKSEREKLFEECVNTLKGVPQCDKVNPHHMDAIEWLIDSGFINAPSS